jgi:hypothetical protein
LRRGAFGFVVLLEEDKANLNGRRARCPIEP